MAAYPLGFLIVRYRIGTMSNKLSVASSFDLNKSCICIAPENPGVALSNVLDPFNQPSLVSAPHMPSVIKVHKEVPMLEIRSAATTGF